jgi:ribosomal protein S18 acetylase RimI-like enzyme
VEILDLRHFSSSDLRPLLEEETQTWSRLLSWDYTSSASMIQRYVDSKILPGYAAVERGRIWGYAFFVYEGSKGVIGDLFVANGGQGNSGHELEARLLLHVIETLQQSPGVHRVEAQLLLHGTGAVARPFLDQGFQRHRRLFMLLSLANPLPAAARLREEFELRRWSEQDYQAAASVITSAYRHHVDAGINDQYRSLSGSLRFLNNIVRFPGCGTFDAESSFVAVHKRTHSLAGLILCSRVRHDVGHVTQICVLPEWRSQRIGQALLAATVADLTHRKFTLLSLTVTEANVHAVELYRRLGFGVHHVFDAFVWEG